MVSKNAANAPKANADSKGVISPVRNRLLDLYKVGEEVEFADDEGTFSVWVQKNDPWEEKAALNKCRAVRGPIIVKKKSLSPEEREGYLLAAESWGLDTKEMMALFLLNPRITEEAESIQSRIADEDKWSGDGYLDSLQAAWNEGASDVYVAGPPDEDSEEDASEYEDAVRVYEALLEYTVEVEEELKHYQEELLKEFENKPLQEIEDQVIEQLIESEANAAQVYELNLWQLYYGVRDPDNHDIKYFDSKDQLAHLDSAILDRLLRVYDELTVSGIEGKD